MVSSPAGDRIASSSERDHAIHIWDTFSGERILPPFRGHLDTIKTIMFSPDGRLLGSGSSDTTIHVWDPTAGRETIPALHGHESGVVCMFSPSSRNIISDQI
jgi:WD40 repeat protein